VGKRVDRTTGKNTSFLISHKIATAETKKLRYIMPYFMVLSRLYQNSRWPDPLAHLPIFPELQRSLLLLDYHPAKLNKGGEVPSYIGTNQLYDISSQDAAAPRSLFGGDRLN
jgi:hypothetical protein